MGTSGSYTGSGSKAGKALRTEVTNWLRDSSRTPSVSHVIGLFRSRGVPDVSSGVGGGGRDGGAQRSSAVSARTAGRAIAVACAYRTGDRYALSDLGLDYDELRELSHLDLICKIVDAACGPHNDGTIADYEQRLVASELADWIIGQQDEGVELELDEIVRKAISCIIFEAISSEISGLIRSGDLPPAASEMDDNDLRDMAAVLADRAVLSVEGVTEREFVDAIENGIETLRDIVELSPDA